MDARLASRRASEPLGGAIRCMPSRTSSTAIPDATSPACAPPMPSATTNSGTCRTGCPRCPAAAGRGRSPPSVQRCAALRSKVNSESPIRIRSPRAAAAGRAAARRSGTSRWSSRGPQDHHGPLGDEPRVRDEANGVLEADVGLIAAPEQRALGEIIGGPGAQARGRGHAQLRRPAAVGRRPAVARCIPVASSYGARPPRRRRAAGP